MNDDSDIKDLDPCLPEDYLQTFAAGRVTDQGLRSIIEAHVELCSECAAKVRSFNRLKLSPDELLEQQLASLRQKQVALKPQHAQGPCPGTIWRTVPKTEKDLFGPLVFVISYTETTEKKFLTVAEVSEDIPQAIETDMILDPQESGLRFRCMVRTGNIFATVQENLKEFAGEVQPRLIEKVSEFCQLGARFDDRVPLSQIVFLQDGKGNEFMRRRGITSGMIVTQENDPRLEFLELSKKRCAYLSGKSASAAHDEAVVIPFPRRPWVKKILALAAVLAAIVVTWESAQIVSDGNIEQLKVEQAKQVAKLQTQYEEASKENSKLLAELEAQKPTLSSEHVEPLDTTRTSAVFNESKKPPMSERGEVGELKNRIARLEKENENLKKYTNELETLRDRATKQLAHTQAELNALESKWPDREKKAMPLKITNPEPSSLLDPIRGKEILRAAQFGAVVTLRNLVENKEYSNYTKSETGERPLHLAAIGGKLDAVEILIDKGADVNSKDKNGRTPLMLAAEKGNDQTVEFLLKRGADPNLSDDGGRTALYWALLYKHDDAARLLKSR